MSLKNLLIYCRDESRHYCRDDVKHYWHINEKNLSKASYTMTDKEINNFLNKKEKKWLDNNLIGITCTINKQGETQIPKIDIIHAIEQSGSWD